MCSVQDGDTNLPVRKQRIEPGRDCMKCHKEKAILITRVNDAFCRDCFLVYLTHKFRATIGKSKLIRDGEKVLVAFSGGPASSCLLKLIQEGLSQRAHKKLRFRPGLLYIDETSVLSNSSVNLEEASCQIKQIMKQTEYPSFICSIAHALGMKGPKETESPGDSAPSHESSSTEPTGSDDVKVIGVDPAAANKLKSLLDSTKSLSAREDLIHRLRCVVMEDIARQHGYSKVMTGHCSTRLAVTLLSDISQGRGSQVAMDTVFADKRIENITVVRPIRDFSSKEIALYNSLMQVETVFIPTLTTKAGIGASIEHLTEAFVTGLQAEYPSTVSNIMRTGEKLTSESGAASNQSVCALCKSPLDTNVGPSSALEAVRFSQQVSSKRQSDEDHKHCCLGNSRCHGDGEGSCSCQSGQGTRCSDVTKTLCYGCRLTAKDVKDKNCLFSILRGSASQSLSRDTMKADIEEFLLDEDHS